MKCQKATIANITSGVEKSSTKTEDSYQETNKYATEADQIQKLAEQSTQSAVDKRQLIESSLAEVEEGNKTAHRAADSIESVVSGIKSIAKTSQELSQISQEQATAMEQAEQGINQISEVVQFKCSSLLYALR